MNKKLYGICQHNFCQKKVKLHTLILYEGLIVIQFRTKNKITTDKEVVTGMYTTWHIFFYIYQSKNCFHFKVNTASI